jgi:hypothetical protein
MATILTTYIVANTLSNHAFACCLPPNSCPAWGCLEGGQEHNNIAVGSVIGADKSHLGQVLGGITTTIHNSLKNHEDAGLTDVLTPHPSYWTPHP